MGFPKQWDGLGTTFHKKKNEITFIVAGNPIQSLKLTPKLIVLVTDYILFVLGVSIFLFVYVNQ